VKNLDEGWKIDDEVFSSYHTAPFEGGKGGDHPGKGINF
jgi:hypothetical protein